MSSSGMTSLGMLTMGMPSMGGAISILGLFGLSLDKGEETKVASFVGDVLDSAGCL